MGIGDGYTSKVKMMIDLRKPRRMPYYELVDRRDYLKRELAKCTDEKDRAVWAEALRDCERALERMEEE